MVDCPRLSARGLPFFSRIPNSQSWILQKPRLLPGVPKLASERPFKGFPSSSMNCSEVWQSFLKVDKRLALIEIGVPQNQMFCCSSSIIILTVRMAKTWVSAYKSFFRTRPSGQTWSHENPFRCWCFSAWWEHEPKKGYVSKPLITLW